MPHSLIFFLICASAAALLAGHFWPQILALAFYGGLDCLPGPITPYMLLTYAWDQKRHLGSTHFARKAVYHPWFPSLTPEQRAAYFEKGYLVLRGLLPANTVAALRDELLWTLGSSSGVPPYDTNAWILSDALLDFLLFGPCGKVAAQLLGRPAHLLFLVHRFRAGSMGPSIPQYHFDSLECEDGYPPADAVLRAKVKFYIALYPDTPAFWFLDQSAFESLLLAVTGNASSVADFKSGRLSSQVLYERILPLADHLDPWSLKPSLALGDAIVHSPCLIHRTAQHTGGRPSGFLGPAYAAPETQFIGHSRYMCDSGVHPSTPVALAPQLKDAAVNGCFLQAYPQPLLQNRVQELTVSFRRGPQNTPWAMYWQARKEALRYVRMGPWPAREPSVSEVPSANVVDLPPKHQPKMGPAAVPQVRASEL